MKLKTSITLSDDVLAAVDELAGEGGSRSAVIERVLRRYLRRRARAVAYEQELERLSRVAERPHGEPADVTDIQAFVASLPDRDRRPPDEILGYDDFGLPG